ncbi:hypothetical protein MIT9_P1611 [Methylomarinovum caldicuralii]|uniref:Zinc ribbon domain-containing protein n=1 Tax=Methylomarinovum caldicuralii TaxID=438856 RepID=A0AAU9C4C9_9GAMM|nr:zinc ribbon domain-containing protein [Methylomarinovum caldicuralii]BCX82029.1 hypothetical protein MIT9_P1611 [Methylomarinovum caldicuralii]
MQAWRKPLQSLVAILFTWLIGVVVASSDLFAETPLLRGLSLADLALFLTQLVILVLLFVLARQIQAALPENGRIASFLRAILPPLATLVILLLAQNLILDIVAPYLALWGEHLLVLLFWLLVIATAAWLVWTSYCHAPELIAGVLAFGGKLGQLPKKLNTCPACGAHRRDDGPYCSYCGTRLETGDSPAEKS